MNNRKELTAIADLRIVWVWLHHLRDDKDLQQCIDKIDEVIKKLEGDNS